MIDVNTCPSCGGRSFSEFLTCVDHTVSFEKFNLMTCTTCDMTITSPRPENEALANYYLSESYTSHINTPKSLLDKVYMTVRHFNLKWKLSQIERYTPTANNKRILDYGCGTGEFLKVSKKKGWNIHGIEPSEQARHYAQKHVLNELSPTVDDLPDNTTFEAITLWHVLEHIPDLDITIQKLKNLLVNNGTLFIAVPNHRSWDGKKYKQYWAGYDVPRHLWHFSKKNMKMLLEKNELTIIEIIPMRLDAFYISLLSEKYLDGNSLTPSAITKGIYNGLKSNFHAKKNKEFSSLLYVAKNESL